MSAQQTEALPRKPSSATDQRSAFSALSDLQDAVRFIPETQYKDVTVVAGDYPLLATTDVRDVQGVTAVGAWLADSDPSTAVYAGGVHWQLGTEAGELKINGFQSLTTGTRYRVKLKIEGKR